MLGYKVVLSKSNGELTSFCWNPEIHPWAQYYAVGVKTTPNVGDGPLMVCKMSEEGRGVALRLKGDFPGNRVFLCEYEPSRDDMIWYVDATGETHYDNVLESFRAGSDYADSVTLLEEVTL
jgi:hypothetical protein